MDDIGGMLFALGTMAIIVMVTIWVPYALINLLRQKRSGKDHEIAAERYARGELSEDEYRQMLSNLES